MLVNDNDPKIELANENSEKLEPLVKEQGFAKHNLSKYLFVNIGLVIIFEAILVGMLFLVTPNNFLQASSNNNQSSVINNYTVLNLVNQERERYNLEKLEINLKLQAAAQDKAQDLLEQGYFSHTSPQGKIFSDWIKASGYHYLRVGENLAIFFADDNKVVDAWMASDKHRQNILNPYYSQTGIAVVKGSFNDHSTQVVVQIFGQPTKQERDAQPFLLTLD